MLPRVADDLGRGVEAHRLAVQQGAGEDFGVEALDPGRDIDEKGKARSVAFGEAIGAEPLDLVEAAGREIGRIPIGEHAGDEFFAEQMDLAIALEGRHRAAQPVGLIGREPGADDRDLHRLFLKKRHPQGLAEHLAQFVGRVFDILLARAPAQIGMDHVALDRPGADDRDLDHQIVEFLGLQARQHRHLAPALDLEDAQ